jgi:hypothetical protein
MPTQGGAAARRRYGLGVEDEGHLKNLIVIFVLLRCFVLFDISLNARVLFEKKLSTWTVIERKSTAKKMKSRIKLERVVFKRGLPFSLCAQLKSKLLRALISLFRFKIYSCLSVSSAVTADEIVVLCDSVVGCT